MRMEYRDLLDAIDAKTMAPWVAIRPEIFYGRELFVADLKARIIHAKKFYMGQSDQIPLIPRENIDLTAFKLPFPLTLFELTVKDAPDMKARAVIVCRDFEDKIECCHWACIKRPGKPDQHIYIPFVFTITKEQGGFKVEAEEEQEFILAYMTNKALLEREIAELEKKIAVMQESKDLASMLGEAAARSALDNMKLRKVFAEKEYKRATRDDIPEDFGQLTIAMYELLVSFLMVLNCKNVERVKHDPPVKLNKARKKRGRNVEDVYYTLTIDRESNKHIFESDDPNSDTGVKLHWRRGHVKHRKTGNYWWSPHLVGNKELGTVEKEYNAASEEEQSDTRD